MSNPDSYYWKCPRCSFECIDSEGPRIHDCNRPTKIQEKWEKWYGMTFESPNRGRVYYKAGGART